MSRAARAIGAFKNSDAMTGPCGAGGGAQPRGSGANDGDLLPVRFLGGSAQPSRFPAVVNDRRIMFWIVTADW